jgi:hypothetical protein
MVPMVSTISMMALGSAGMCAFLALSFYRKYQDRVRIGGPAFLHHYARVADYRGVPLPLAFRYLSEGAESWTEVEADVDEIFHYGSDYFMRGFGVADRRGLVFKSHRIAGLRVRSDGRSLASVQALLGEVAGHMALPHVEKR